MTVTFRPAQREQTWLMLGLMGPSGGGKTKSALRLATGIQSVVGGKIIGIDTEARRMLRYADQFKFDYCEFHAPFGSLRYAEILVEASKAGASVIIVDSMSHEHEGPGGYLETHEAELRRLVPDGNEKRRDKMKFAAWIKPAGDRRRLINTILQIPAHFVFAFRAKEKMALVKQTFKFDDGREGEKTVPIDIGWQPIAGDEFAYEMQTMCLLPPRANGIPQWEGHQGVKLDELHREVFAKPRQLSEEIGAELAKLSQGGASAPKRDAPAEIAGTIDEAKSLTEYAEKVAKQGTEALKDWFERQSKHVKKLVKPELDRIKKIAADADAEGDVGFDDPPNDQGQEEAAE